MANELSLIKNDELSFDEAINQGVKEFGIIATFSVDSEEALVSLYKAQNSAEPLSDTEGSPIDIVNIAFVEPSAQFDSDDDTEPSPAVILFAKDGNCYFSGSKGVFESAKSIISTFGMPSTWSAPKTVILKTRTTRAGRSYKYLDM